MSDPHVRRRTPEEPLRRLMRRRIGAGLLAALALIAVAAVAVDLAARLVAEHALATRAKTSTSASGSKARISSFPFLYDLLVDGEARTVKVHLSGVPVGLLRIARVDVTADGVHIDKGELIDHRKVRVASVAAATATLTITAADVSAATGVDVAVSGDTVTADIAGVKLPVEMKVTDGHVLTLGAVGKKVFSFDLASSPIVPPCQMNLVSSRGALTLTCRVSPVPQSVIAALSSSG